MKLISNLFNHGAASMVLNAGGMTADVLQAHNRDGIKNGENLSGMLLTILEMNLPYCMKKKYQNISMTHGSQEMIISA